MSPKAATKPVTNLGTKRVCPKCSAKFYDFAKSEIECPKCGHELDPTKPASHSAPVKATPVARKIEEADTDVTPAAGTGDFESLEDLESDDDNIVEDLAADTSSDDDNY